jgi:hypothetical protein
MTTEHFNAMRRDPLYKSGVAFISALRAEGVPLAVFVTSDWHSAPAYVYLDMRGTNGFREKNCRKCSRFDKHGIRQAVAWYKKMINA